MPKNTIAGLFTSCDANRQRWLKRARTCARLTKPWILPPEGHVADNDLPDNFQSIGSRGAAALTGKTLLALFPPEQPWFVLQPTPKVFYGQAARQNPDLMRRVLMDMQYRAVQLQAQVESASVAGMGHQRNGFRSKKRQVIDYVLICGDALEQITDDYQLKVFRPDNYVTRRDSSGNVLFHVVREMVDVLTLTDRQFEACALDATMRSKPVSERMQPIYTKVEWQPLTKVWRITQEINDRVVNESEEPVSPYISTPFELVEGEDYGHSFVEQNKGELLSVDELNLRMLQYAELATKCVPIIDPSSEIKPKDLAQPSGQPVYGRVAGGQQQDMAFLRVDKLSDIQPAAAMLASKEQSLARAFLLESASAPSGERVTAYQVDRVRDEVNGALGTLYAPLADEQQIGTVRRLYYQMERDNLFTVPIPRDFVNIVTLTGFAALARQAEARNVTNFVATVAAMGPEAMSRVDLAAAIDILARYTLPTQLSIIKSDERIAAEQQQALAAQAQAQAAEKAIDVAGNVAQSQLTGASASA